MAALAENIATFTKLARAHSEFGVHTVQMDIRETGDGQTVIRLRAFAEEDCTNKIVSSFGMGESIDIASDAAVADYRSKVDEEAHRAERRFHAMRDALGAT